MLRRLWNESDGGERERRLKAGKKIGLSARQVAEILENDLSEKQYFVTGNLTQEIFADNCRFLDPTNDTVGLKVWQNCLRK